MEINVNNQQYFGPPAIPVNSHLQRFGRLFVNLTTPLTAIASYGLSGPDPGDGDGPGLTRVPARRRLLGRVRLRPWQTTRDQPLSPAAISGVVKLTNKRPNLCKCELTGMADGPNTADY